MSRTVLINGESRYIGDNLKSFLSRQRPGATFEQAEDEEETTNVNAMSPDETFKVTSINTETSRENILAMALNSDVIVWSINDISDNNAMLHDVADGTWLIDQLGKCCENFQSTKQFILVSTVATWARSKLKDPEDPDVAFDESDFRTRRSHLSFKEHLALEKTVIKAGKIAKLKFACHVICSGIQYGKGESTFHYMFKQPWLDVNKEVCVYGSGKNRIPMIHITDLAQIVANVIDHKPVQKYIIAIDQAINTLGQITKTVVKNIGHGRIRKVKDINAINSEEDITSPMADLLQINLTFEQSDLLKDAFTINWTCDSGLVNNVEEIVAEYRNARKLLPVRLCILAPPQGGKTALARKLALEYQLHVITATNLVKNTVEQLQEVVARTSSKDDDLNLDEDDAEENEDDEDTQLEEARDLLNDIEENLASLDGRLQDEIFCKIFNHHLHSKKCKNQGFILDGFPKTKEQAAMLFAVTEGEAEDFDDGDLPVAKHLPEMVISLEASDDWLKQRVMHLEESSIQGTHNDEENFLRRLTTYRSSNTEDDSPLSYFDENEVHPQSYILDGRIDATVIDEKYGMQKPKPGDEPNDGSYGSILTHLRELIGKPRNYGPSPTELAEIKLVNEKKQRDQEKAEAEELVARQEEEERLRKERMQEWSEQLAEVHRQEAESFQAASLELRNYLMKHVLPTLTKAVHETTKVKPKDPIDFIAEYLFKHNPQYD